MIISAGDVFLFVGSTEDVNEADEERITALIIACQADLESTLGRKVDDTDYENVILADGINCSICGTKLFLKGEGRDLYSITSLYENGSLLTAVAAYNDGGDYFLDPAKGIIHRNLQNWSTEPFAIKITGKVNISHSEQIHEGIKQILIEMVAAKSGLWKQNVETEGGTIQTIRTNVSAETKRTMKKYILRDIV